MADSFRRIILTPSGLSEQAKGQLAQTLEDAVSLQRKLAADSPHILRPFGSIQREGDSYYFEHEPADPIDISQLFDPNAPGLAGPEWLAAGVALAEAMRHAHEGAGAMAHGGISPGVLLKSYDGIWKVTDFRIAPALCDVLGVESYLNLAIGRRDSGQKSINITGAWEALTESEYERDDRICAFIDPEKYASVIDHGERMLATFEPGSDIVAAGILLGLMAQGIHPFLGDYPEAHRFVDMSRMMASALAAPIRRKDLVESGEPGVKELCKLLDRMLQRLPKDRPRAAEIADELKNYYVAKIDYEAIKKRQDEAELQVWIERIDSLYEAKAWSELEKALDEQSHRKELPPKIAARADEIRKKLNEFSQAERRQAQMKADDKAAREWFGEFSRAHTANELEKARDIARRKPALEFWPEDILKQLEPLEKALAKELKRLDDFEAARKWLAEIVRSVEGDDWIGAEKTLAKKPSLEFWPDEVIEQIDAHAKKIREQIKIIQAQHQKAKHWLEEARQAVRIKAYARAIEILNHRPDLQHWPVGLLEESDALNTECTERIGEDAFAALRQHLDALERAGRVFVKTVVEADFAKLLSAAIVRASVDSDQVTSEDTMDCGKALFVLALPDRGDLKDVEPAQVPFEYNLAEKKAPILDPEKKTSVAVRDALRSLLAKYQSNPQPPIVAALKQSLYPEITCKCDLKDVAAAATGQIQLTRAPADKLTIELTWDAQGLAWNIANTTALTTEITNRVKAAASAAVMNKAVEASPLIREYQKILRADVQPSNPLSGGAVSFNGTLTLLHPRDQRPIAVQTVKGEISAIDRIELFGTWSEAEAELSGLLVEEQNSARQTAVDMITEQASVGGAKPKVTAAPKRIKAPTSEITIEVRVKGAPVQNVVGKWNPAKFGYELSGFNAAQLTAAVADQLPASPPVKSGNQSAADTGAPTPVAPTSKFSRKALIGGGALAGVAIVAVLMIINSGKKPVQTPPITDPTPPVVDKTPPKDDTNPPTANDNATDVVADRRPDPPATLDVLPTDILASADTELARAFVDVLTQIDGAAPTAIRVAFGQSWQVSDNNARNNATVELGGSPAEIGCTLQYDEESKSWGDPKWSLREPGRLGEIAEWLSRRAARRIAALAEQKELAQADGMYEKIAPIINALAERGRGAPFPSRDEVVAASIRRDSPVPAEEYQWEGIFADSHPALAALIHAARSDGNQDITATAKPNFQTGEWNLTDATASTNRATFKILDRTISFECRFAYSSKTDTHADAPTWVLQTDTAELKTLADALVRRALDTIDASSRQGRLAAAHAVVQRLESAAGFLQSDTALTSVAIPVIELPPIWSENLVTGYSPAEERDEATGYAKRIISERDGRSMLLVALHASDPVWDAVGVPPPERGWRIFYVDAREWNDDQPESMKGRAYEFSDAQLRAELAELRVPTIREWTLAALKLRNDTAGLNFLDGLYEWCSDPVDGVNEGDRQARWVTGGCDIHKSFNLPKRPKLSDPDEAWVTWLRHELVTQKRQYADGLVGLRAIKPIYPPTD